MNHSQSRIMPSYSGIDKKEEQESKGSRDAITNNMEAISLQMRASRITI
jgi:hypothetical protein